MPMVAPHLADAATRDQGCGFGDDASALDRARATAFALDATAGPSGGAPAGGPVSGLHESRGAPSTTDWRLLAGAALVYRIAPGWDCVVAWGDELQHRRDRVMNLLVYQLVRLAIAQRVTVIDIGISSVDGVPDDGLIQFKRHVGGVTGLRINFRLPLA